MRHPYHHIAFILFILLQQSAVAQKYVQDYVTDENINNFTDWRELGSAQKLKMNKNWHLSLIKKIDHYEKYDSLEVVKFIDSLAGLKMNATFHFLTDLCCRYIDYRNKNNLTRMVWILNHYGGPQALNKYYLKDSIPPRPNDPSTFHAEVYYAMREKFGNTMASSHFLKPYIPPPVVVLPKKVAARLSQRLECDSAILINSSNINELESPWQFLCLNRRAINATDSLVAVLTRYDNQFDSLTYTKLVDRLISLRTPESECVVLNLLFRPILIHDFNAFNGLASTLSFYGGYSAINKHYLNNRIDTTLPREQLEHQVYLLMYDKIPDCYYCKPKTQQQMMIMRMEKVNVSKMDRKILNIIEKHGNLRKIGGFTNYHLSLDTILKDVLKLEGITDATYDYCRIKTCIYPGYCILGVRFTTDSITIDRCYRIQLGYSNSSFFILGHRIPFITKPESIRGNELFSRKEWAYFYPNFIEEERALCRPPEIEIEE